MNDTAVIFDFNGTLFWDTHFHDKAFDIFLKRYGKTLTDDEKRVIIHGKANPEIMRSIFGQQLTTEEITEKALEKEQIYRDLCENELAFAPGAEDFFNFLKTNQIPMTIATSAGIENVSFYFERMKLDRWFSLDKTAYNDGTLRGKPNPDVFLSAAQKLNVHPSKTIIFEDSIAGIIAAEQAGAGKIYIVNSYSEDYSRFPHEVITHFDAVNRDLFI